MGEIRDGLHYLLSKEQCRPLSPVSFVRRQNYLWNKQSLLDTLDCFSAQLNSGVISGLVDANSLMGNLLFRG